MFKTVFFRSLLIAGALVSAQSWSAILEAQGYDRHVELSWKEIYQPGQQYLLHVSVDSGEWQPRAVVTGDATIDFTGDLGRNLQLEYRLVEENSNEVLATAFVSTRDFTDEELLDMVQRYTFRYFWDHADPESGWARERIANMDSNIITSGGTGFGIASVITGAERGWISRSQAVDRMLKLTKSLREFERFHGMWAHWYDADSQEVYHFSEFDDGGDIVESAFMAQGLLTRANISIAIPPGRIS